MRRGSFGLDDEEARAMRRPVETDLGPLFADPVPVARITDPGTSHLAARSMLDAAAQQRLLIVGALDGADDAVGFIADELDQLLFPDNPSRPSGRRMCELVEAGEAEVIPDVFRPTRSGRMARAYRRVRAHNQKAA